MAEQTPKPMRKVNRNIFKKVGKKLGEFEQSLGLASPNLAHGSVQSLSTLSDSYYDEQPSHEETVSLRSMPSHETESPREVRHRKNPSGHSTSSYGEFSNASWEDEGEVSVPYDQEMRIICQDLVDNKTVNLYDWRAYDKKVSLLRTAVSFNTPKVTGPVILFLENTLSKALFYELIKQYPSAVKNYINLVKLRPDKENHLATLKQFGRSEDLAMIYLRQASQNNDVHRKLAQLDQAAIELASHSWWQTQVAEYRYLIEKQQEIQSSLSSASSSSKVRLENRTVLDTYKIVYDKDFRQQRQNRSSVSSMIERSQEIERAFHMSPEMVMCGKLSVIMSCGLRLHYDDFVHQAIHQGLFGKSYVIAPQYLADMVYKWVRFSGEGDTKAIEKAEKFIILISDPRKRIYYAEKFENYDIAIDTIVNNLRERYELENFRRRIPHDHPSFQRATYFLENTKWRK